jgi:hypothetical protein
VDNEAVTFPDQVIRDTAKRLRTALRKAAEDAGLPCPQDALPSTGKGGHLSYRLVLG